MEQGEGYYHDDGNGVCEKSEGRGGEEGGGEGGSRGGPGAEAGREEEGGEEESPTKDAGEEGQALFWGEKDCQSDRLHLSGHGAGQGKWAHPCDLGARGGEAGHARPCSSLRRAEGE